MAYFMVKHEGAFYVNAELFYKAVAGGERSFMKMLAGNEVEGKKIFDQILYPVTEAQRKSCALYALKLQDADKELAILRKAESLSEGRVITVHKSMASKLIEHRGFRFIKIRDLNRPEKYRLLPKLAVVRVCSCSYVALDAASEGVEDPIVVVISE
jgi:hypothetical protein